MPASEIEIQSVPEFEGGPGWYQCRGHVPKAEFLAALQEQCGVVAKPENVEHVWIHYTPIWDGDRWLSSGMEYYQPGRGRAPMTSVTASLCPRKQEAAK